MCLYNEFCSIGTSELMYSDIHCEYIIIYIYIYISHYFHFIAHYYSDGFRFETPDFMEEDSGFMGDEVSNTYEHTTILPCSISN